MDKYELSVTEDVGEAIVAFIDGSTVLYHECQDDKITGYEMDGSERLTDFDGMDNAIFFIYRKKEA